MAMEATQQEGNRFIRMDADFFRQKDKNLQSEHFFSFYTISETLLDLTPPTPPPPPPDNILNQSWFKHNSYTFIHPISFPPLSLKSKIFPYIKSHKTIP